MKTHQQLVDMELELDTCLDRRAEIRVTMADLKKELEKLEDRIDDLRLALNDADEEAEAVRIAEVAR